MDANDFVIRYILWLFVRAGTILAVILIGLLAGIQYARADLYTGMVDCAEYDYPVLIGSEKEQERQYDRVQARKQTMAVVCEGVGYISPIPLALDYRDKKLNVFEYRVAGKEWTLRFSLFLEK